MHARIAIHPTPESTCALQTCSICQAHNVPHSCAGGLAPKSRPLRRILQSHEYTLRNVPDFQVWCEDFLGLGNISRPASCCRKDDEVLRGWCAGASRSDVRYSAACDPWSYEFGSTNWVVGPDGELEVADPSRWQDVQDESSFCEVLGKVRRSRWHTMCSVLGPQGALPYLDQGVRW